MSHTGAGSVAAPEELRPHHTGDTFWRRWGRRAISIPAYLALFVLLTATLPAVLVAALLADLLRRMPLVLVRTVAFLELYLACEVLGILASLGAWLLSGIWAGVGRERFEDWSYRLQHWWGNALGRGAFAIFDIRLHVEWTDGPPPSDRPFILFIRHVSVADTILAVMLVSADHGIRLRYVLKRELLWDPCLDIVGNRIPNYFVVRGGDDSEREIAGVARLADGLQAGQGVLLYPEGTRFSAAKRERIVSRFQAQSDEEAARRARALGHVLPPRSGGALALLETSACADAVFCAHTGLEGSASFWDLWNGGLVGSTVRVRFWRVRREHIPRSRPARIAWLYDQWTRVDAFVAAAGD